MISQEIGNRSNLQGFGLFCYVGLVGPLGLPVGWQSRGRWRNGSPVAAWMMRVPAWIRPMTMWWSFPLWRRVTAPVLSMVSVRIRPELVVLQVSPGRL